MNDQYAFRYTSKYTDLLCMGIENVRALIDKDVAKYMEFRPDNDDSFRFSVELVWIDNG